MRGKKCSVSVYDCSNWNNLLLISKLFSLYFELRLLIEYEILPIIIYLLFHYYYYRNDGFNLNYNCSYYSQVNIERYT